MSKLEYGVEVACRTEEVWGIVGDFGKDDRWRRVERMVSDPPGPARVGTTTHEVLRFLGSTYVTDAALTAVEPGRSLAFEGGGRETAIRGYRRVEEASGGARYVSGLEIKLSGPIRLFEPLLARLFALRVRSELRTLKRLLEGTPSPAVPIKGAPTGAGG